MRSEPRSPDLSRAQQIADDSLRTCHLHCRSNDHAVAIPKELERQSRLADLAWNRDDGFLAGQERGNETDRGRRFTRGESGDDGEAVLLDRVVGHAGDITQADTLGLDGSKLLSDGDATSQGSRNASGTSALVHSILL